MQTSDPGVHPPLPAPHLTVGIAGHRDIAPELTPALIEQVERLLAKSAAWRGRSVEAAVAMAPTIVVLSQLAAGADQLAAQAALDLGLTIDAVLPFDVEEYRLDFEDEARGTFETLLDRSRGVWSLPCPRSSGDTAYVLAGSLMLGQADLLIALWDGEHARGPGGTAEVVDEAIRRGVPVVHIPVGDGEPRILWGWFDGLSTLLMDSQTVPSRALDDDHVAMMLDAILLPPAVAEQRQALEAYLRERERRVRLRVEYALLLAVTAIRPLSRAAFRVGRYHETTRKEWSPFHTALEPYIPDAESFHGIERAFCWADKLADHYAQIYRSGTILNYVLAALAVVTALLGLLIPDVKPMLISLELLFVGALILNTWEGNRQQWHRRWLDYRYLAEQLRPMRSLKLLGAASSARAWDVRGRGGGRWTDWYAAAVWREMGLPPSIAAGAGLRSLVGHIVTHEIDPQITYHRVNAHRMERLDHRLHRLGTGLFMATLLASFVGLAGYIFDVHAIHDQSKLLTVLAAGLPTLGSALFGIRGHSDFAGAARRSLETAAGLERSASRLGRDPLGLATAVRVVEDAAATMAADLGEWRTSFQDRKLAIPS